MQSYLDAIADYMSEDTSAELMVFRAHTPTGNEALKRITKGQTSSTLTFHYTEVNPLTGERRAYTEAKTWAQITASITQMQELCPDMMIFKT